MMEFINQAVRFIIIAAYRYEKINLTIYGHNIGVPRNRGECLVLYRRRLLLLAALGMREGRAN